MAIDINEVTRRWEKLRGKSECNLSIEPGVVAEFVNQKKSDLVKNKINETLIQLANLRLAKGFFASDDPNAQGDIVSCEGLESFLIPAVENVLPISDFLKEYEKGIDLASALLKDINQLLEDWEKRGFQGRPYLNSDAILGILEPGARDEAKKGFNNTESAAYACRVIIHLVNLHYNRPDEEYFSQIIGDELDIDRLRKSLKKAISFLVDAFQKGKDNSIGSAVFKKKPGSGWSWTNWQGLPPMLFFTSTAVDTFAELELYLIRKAKRGVSGDVVEDIYNENQGKLLEYEFCVDMARRWVLNSILPYISTGLGMFPEKLPNGSKLDFKVDFKDYNLYKVDIAREEALKESPLVFYNNLYAILILLWSFADWDDSAEAIESDTKSKIERSIMQVVNNYSRIDVVREILNRFPYVFYLPGEEFFIEDSPKDAREYMDSGFLTLLTRHIVLCAVYGVGDPDVLGNLIESLYLELLLNRNREDPEYPYLWSVKSKEIFSTQRALQALTFYYAYVKAKEVGLKTSSRPAGPTLPLEVRIPENANWGPFISRVQSSIEAWQKNTNIEYSEPSKSKLNITARNFADHLKKNKFKVALAITEEQMNFLAELSKIGDNILSDFHKKKISNNDAVALLEGLCKLISNPWSKDGSPLKEKLNNIKTNHKKIESKKK
jgi:hypothetical protein